MFDYVMRFISAMLYAIVFVSVLPLMLFGALMNVVKKLQRNGKERVRK